MTEVIKGTEVESPPAIDVPPPVADKAETPPANGAPSGTESDKVNSPEPEKGILIGGNWYPSQEAANQALIDSQKMIGQQSTEIGNLRGQKSAPDDPEPEWDALDESKQKAWMDWNQRKVTKEFREVTRNETRDQELVRSQKETRAFMQRNPNLTLKAAEEIGAIKTANNISYVEAQSQYDKMQAKPAQQTVDKQNTADKALPGLEGGGGAAVGDVDLDKLSVEEWEAKKKTMTTAEIRAHLGG